MSRRRRLAMVDRGHPKLSVVKQCRLLRLSRSSVYYRPAPAKPADLELMAGMDRQYLKTPYYGSRRMTAWPRTQGHLVNRKRVQRADAGNGTGSDLPQAQHQQACAGAQDIPLPAEGRDSRRGQLGLGGGHHLPAHVPGVLYLVAIMDCHSRYMLAWKLSNTLEVDFCIDALKEALSKGQPEIFNTDQGSQFTSEAAIMQLGHLGSCLTRSETGRYAFRRICRLVFEMAPLYRRPRWAVTS